MVPTRSILWWFCGIAGVFCLAPRAVSDPSVGGGPEPAHESRQASIRLRSGTLAANVRWTRDDEAAADVLRGRIEFRPDAVDCSSCSSIRFIQIARTERNGGIDYEWSGMEQNRNRIRTTSRMGVGIFDGYFVDHKASVCAPASACSPYFRDHWANPRESGDGYQAGGSSAPSALVDYPFGWDTMERIALESCARCVDTGEFLGCSQWGAQWPAQGQRTISPIRFSESPSPTFLSALRKFDEFYNPFLRANRE
jgi:hypothetical protein